MGDSVADVVASTDASTPYVLLPSQQARRGGHAGPERALMMAVLGDALGLIVGTVRVSGQLGRRLVHEAWEWVDDEDRSWPFSFPNVCDALDVDSGALRGRLHAQAVRPEPYVDQRTVRKVAEPVPPPPPSDMLFGSLTLSRWLVRFAADGKLDDLRERLLAGQPSTEIARALDITTDMARHYARLVRTACEGALCPCGRTLGHRGSHWKAPPGPEPEMLFGSLTISAALARFAEGGKLDALRDGLLAGETVAAMAVRLHVHVDTAQRWMRAIREACPDDRCRCGRPLAHVGRHSAMLAIKPVPSVVDPEVSSTWPWFATLWFNGRVAEAIRSGRLPMLFNALGRGLSAKAAAAVAGMDVGTAYTWMRRLGLRPPPRRCAPRVRVAPLPAATTPATRTERAHARAMQLGHRLASEGVALNGERIYGCRNGCGRVLLVDPRTTEFSGGMLRMRCVPRGALA